MVGHPDEERIRRKAHELWEAEGHPHGRDRDHWDEAREIIAIEDSQAATLLPRDSGAVPEGANPPSEVDGDIPGLTDQGENDLTDVSREPEFAPGPATALAAPKSATRTAAKSVAPSEVTSPVKKPVTKKKK